MALLVGVMLSVFGQLSGVNIVVYYGPKILDGRRATKTSPRCWDRWASA